MTTSEVSRRRQPFGLWRSSVSFRYLLVSLVAAILPLGMVVLLYDRYAENLVLSFTGERLETELATTTNKLADFLRTRAYQLESLADYPELPELARADTGQFDPRAMAVLRFEIDSPDLYGVLFFDGSDRIVSTLGGLGASDSADRITEGLSVAGMPHAAFQGVELIGPVSPHDGRPGWFILRRWLTGDSVSLALQVRLASLTELLGAHGETRVYRPILMTPGGKAFTTVGAAIALDPTDILKQGPEIAPGWRVAMLRPSDALLMPSRWMRYLLAALAATSAGALIWLFVHLSVRMRRRVAPLVEGAQALAHGDLTWRAAVRGKDEIAVLAGALNDMSAQLRALIESRVDVEKRASLGEFATSIAHEVRNPLATIKASIQALELSERESERREMLVLVVEEIERINDVIEALLSFARPANPVKADILVRELFRRVIALSGPMAEEAHVQLAASGDRELRVHADQAHVQQILTNLMLNAIQAMPNGGALTLRAQREGEQGVITVSDTGHGVPAEQVGRIGEPFFTTKANGTGLGLAISRQLAELNGGSLAIASTPGHGTVVTLKLPLVAQASAVQAA